MDLCRGTQEVEAVLSEGCEKRRSRDPLARLKMAVQYEEKKVDNRTDQLISSSCLSVLFFLRVVFDNRLFAAVVTIQLQHMKCSVFVRMSCEYRKILKFLFVRYWFEVRIHVI